MDIQMPVLDGIQATIEIRKLEAGTDKHLPIFAVTAAAMVETRNALLPPVWMVISPSLWIVSF
jgi:CheY-like chemotaxis protein